MKITLQQSSQSVRFLDIPIGNFFIREEDALSGNVRIYVKINLKPLFNAALLGSGAFPTSHYDNEFFKDDELVVPVDEVIIKVPVFKDKWENEE